MSLSTTAALTTTLAMASSRLLASRFELIKQFNADFLQCIEVLTQYKLSTNPLLTQY